MRVIVFFGLLLISVLTQAQTITANGNYEAKDCRNGKGRVEVFDGGSGYDSGVVTLQFFSTATGGWETVCPTAADCQWSSGDSGAVPFDVGPGARVRLNLARESLNPNPPAMGPQTPGGSGIQMNPVDAETRRRIEEALRSGEDPSLRIDPTDVPPPANNEGDGADGAGDGSGDGSTEDPAGTDDPGSDDPGSEDPPAGNPGQ